MPPTLLELAEDSTVHAPAWPGYPQVVTDRYAYVAGATGAMVQRVRLGDDVAAARDEVRALAREHARRSVTWWCGELATPADVVERLLELGCVPEPDAPTLTSMAITRAPNGAGSDAIEVRRVTTVEDYVRALEINWTCWDDPEEKRAVERANAERDFAALREQGASEFYLAFAGDKLVAFARAVFGDHAAVLLGGGTLPEARGLGAYKELVHVRWRDAVERGTPALVVQAGDMSRPILERLGFEPLGGIRLLLDDLVS